MKKELIKKWCEIALLRTKKINYQASSSYGLKHYCEDSIGEYVSNTEIKQVMDELGFIKNNDVNPVYNISKIINRVVFENRKKNIYSDKNRCFHQNAKRIVCVDF